MAEASASPVVGITTHGMAPNHFQPWATGQSFSVGGSGCIISGKRILTNAHVVTYQTVVMVRREGEPDPVPARVVAVAHDADLAVLTVDDPAFFEGVEPLEFAGIPSIQSEVTVLGYPAGGDALCATSGVISRVERQTYAHSGMSLLAGQIDAAINPGNSGGPVLHEGRLAGVVMQNQPDAQSVGFMVPVPIIERVLADLEDGRYDGFGDDGAMVVPLASPTERASLGLGPKRSGVRVSRVHRAGPSMGLFEPNDVLLEVNGRAIANDGTINYAEHLRAHYSTLLANHLVGEPVKYLRWRAGKAEEVSLKLARYYDLFPLERVPFEAGTNFVVYAGLVFVGLSRNYMDACGQDWRIHAPMPLSTLYFEQWFLDLPEQPPVLSHVIPSPVTEGYYGAGGFCVTRVNGRAVRSVRELAEAIDAASDSQWLTFEGGRHERLVLDRAKADAAHPEIMKRNGIPLARRL